MAKPEDDAHKDEFIAEGRAALELVPGAQVPDAGAGQAQALELIRAAEQKLADAGL
jgi:hypothetical protein